MLELKRTCFILALALMAAFMTGCGNAKPPVIDSCTPAGTTLTIERAMPQQFSVSASDPDGDKLRYQWVFTDGSTSHDTGTSIDWQAPETLGTCSASVTVSDGKHSVTHNWTITVIPLQLE